MALNDNALVTWELTQSILDLPDGSQTLGEFLINSASQRAENIAKREFGSEERTQYYAGDGREKIILDNYPVTVISGLWLDASREFGDNTEITSDKYELEDGEGIIYLFDRVTPEGRKTIKITYTGGYSTIPTDLQQAVIETVACNLQRFSPGSALMGTKTLSVPDGMNTTYEIQVPLNARQVFESYGDKRV